MLFFYELNYIINNYYNMLFFYEEKDICMKFENKNLNSTYLKRRRKKSYNIYAHLPSQHTSSACVKMWVHGTFMNIRTYQRISPFYG